MDIANVLNEKNRLLLLADYFKTHGIIHHQLNTFNSFINFDINTIIDNEANIIFKTTPINSAAVTYCLKMENIICGKPIIFNSDRSVRPLYPHEARLKMLSYDGILYADIVEYIVPEGVDIAAESGNLYAKLQYVTKHIRVPFAKIPIMVKSTKCNLHGLTLDECVQHGESEIDPGGYFIINGNERILVGQMRNTYNKSVCYRVQGGVMCDMRSMSDETGHSSLVSLRWMDGSYIEYLFGKKWIPIAVVLRVLEYGNVTMFEPYLQEESENLYAYYQSHPPIDITEPERYKISNIFPHLGISASSNHRLAILASMIKKIFLLKKGLIVPDVRDMYSNKRVEMAGLLIYELFRLLYKRYVKSMTNALIKKNKTEIDQFTRITIITQGLHYSFSTGNWGAPKNNYLRSGVCQMILNKNSVLSFLSCLRKLNIPIGKEGKNMKVRQIHPSSVFFVCPAETPEGQLVGLTLSLSMIATVSTGMHIIAAKEIILQIPSVIPFQTPNACTKVFLNGSICGYTENMHETYTSLLDYKYARQLQYDTSITFNPVMNEIYVQCDAGRLIRPLINLAKVNEYMVSNTPINWQSIDECVANNIVSFYDAAEIENSFIAIDTNMLTKYPDAFQFMEIHPACMLGLTTAQIPYADHTQSPRNCYQSSMVKQAIGFIPGYNLRSDTTKVMPNVERPLISTQIAEMIGLNQYPNGLNILVAVASYTGYNQEDSIILKKEAIEAGMFNCMTLKTIICYEERNSPSLERICIPSASIRKNHYNYSLLEDDPSSAYYGVVRLKSYVKKNDVIVGKIFKSTSEEDKSVVVSHLEEGYVDNIIRTTRKGLVMFKITILQNKIPEIGDKFCSAMAQKGTCGMILPAVDMPFCADGTIPDMIINPHCLPSRMTINQWMASLQATLRALLGCAFGDASPFQETTADSDDDKITILCKALAQEGYAFDGTYEMMNGMTGERLSARIFMGPVYYHRLTHMVSDKIFARPSTNQKRNTLTRQPLNGRSNDGGLRIGEMEKDNLLAHGAARFLQEKLVDLSDYFTIRLCVDCYNFTTIVKTEDPITDTTRAPYYTCTYCGGSNISECNLPFSAKLLLCYLISIGIKTKIAIQ